MRKTAKKVEKLTLPATDRWRALGPALLVAITLACYWTPMTSSGTSILWDAADYYQVVQNYLAQELHAGRMPFWTPFPWGGYPFLADPQVGAWYPLNWPFFLLGVSPQMLVVEHWMHALLACLGAYFLTFRLIGNRPAAVVSGLCYGLSGFYTGHSSHTTMLQCAAWMPWLLLLFDKAMASRTAFYTALAGMAAGMMILAGHFQTILYSFMALGLFAVARVIAEPRMWRRAFPVALAIPLIGTFLSAIGVAPGLELTLHSVRAGLSAIVRTEGLIPLKALATLLYPNTYKVFSEDYSGPPDITQYYFYAGILLLPLAIFGLRKPAVRWIGVLLTIPTIWYAMGQGAGLYLLVARLPGFSSVRAPVNVWFVPALGLAILAGAGLTALTERWPVKWLPAVILLVFAADLFYWNSDHNPLAYARTSYQELYRQKEDLFVRAVVRDLPPLTRFDAPEHLPVFGPMSHFLSERTETTYGYGPLELARYHDYVDAMQSNLKLRNGLNVSRYLDAQIGAVRVNPDVMPRVDFPKQLVPVRSEDESRRLLVTLDQTRQALAPPSVEVAAQDANGVAQVREYSPGHYRIHYRCASPSLLRISNAFFDGWTGHAGTKPLEIVPVDHALMGVVLPAGEGDVDVDYHSTYFLAGAAVSLLSALACIAFLFVQSRRQLTTHQDIP